ncbi:DoxX family protein [Streptomyces sp. NPDC001492]
MLPLGEAVEHQPADFEVLAALGLILINIGAIATHARRKEAQVIGVNVDPLLLAAAVV